MATTPHLDILMRDGDGSCVWVEAAHDLQSAKVRLRELIAANPAEYFVFDHRAQKVVISVGASSVEK